MPARDFEKSIQEKARELRLTPSDDVWQRVAEQIQTRRRRRGLAWIFLAAAIVGGAISFWLLPPLETINQSPVTSIETPGLLTADPNNRSNTKPNTNNITKANTNDISNTYTNPRIKPGTVLPQNPSEGPSISTSPGGEMNITAGIHKSAGRKKQLLSFNDPAGNKAGKASLHLGNNHPTALGQGPDYSRIHAIPANGYDIEVPAPAALSGDSQLTDSLLAAKPESKTKDSKWSIDVAAGIGRSSLGNGLFESASGRAMEMQPNVSLPLFGAAAAPARSPADVKPGPAFYLGAAVNRELNKKLQVSVGIQYAYQTNRIKVGQEIDSASALLNSGLQPFTSRNTYAGAGNNGNTYYNAYHWIQLPVEISWKLDRKGKLSLNNGFSLGYLVSTDALHYNQQAGVYYKDINRVQRLMAAVQSGIHYQFASVNGFRISAGPQAQYQLNSIDKNVSGKNMLYIGIGAKLHLNKK